MSEPDRADKKYVATLTTRESLLLLGLCLGAGVIGGVLMFLAKLGNESHEWAAGFLEKPAGPISVGSPNSFSLHGAAWQWITPVYIVSLLLLGPGTWFSVLGRFGKRGAERSKFMCGGWPRFNLLSFGIAGITCILLYACHLWWS